VRGPCLIEADCYFRGLVAFRGDARIDGSFEGEVVAGGTLRLGEGARVRARIEVDELVVAGVLEGRVDARRRVELLPGAHVQADLRTPRLVLAEGSFLHGCCATAPEAPAAASRNARLP
jgi:cytoskeletal protein CcmA (bactofilin family)